MSERDVTALEDRLRDTLHAVAALVPDHAPERTATEAVTPLRAVESPAASGSHPRMALRNRRVLATTLVAAAAVVVALVVGALLLTSQDSARRVRVGAGGEPGQTSAVTTTPDPNLVEVPNVLGMTQADASAVLTQAGFTAVIRPEPAMPSQVGLVVAQDPALGRAPRGSQVKIAIGIAG
jgi:hypothetical protein